MRRRGPPRSPHEQRPLASKTCETAGSCTTMERRCSAATEERKAWQSAHTRMLTCTVSGASSAVPPPCLSRWAIAFFSA
eukprot:4277187-Prymnesium_polylepis.2